MVPLRCRELRGGTRSGQIRGRSDRFDGHTDGRLPRSFERIGVRVVVVIEGELRWFHRSGRLHCMFRHLSDRRPADHVCWSDINLWRVRSGESLLGCSAGVHCFGPVIDTSS